jgi:hypothetical protein
MAYRAGYDLCISSYVHPYSSATFSAISSRLIIYGLDSPNVLFIQVDLPTDGGPTKTQIVFTFLNFFLYKGIYKSQE